MTSTKANQILAQLGLTKVEADPPKFKSLEHFTVFVWDDNQAEDKETIIKALSRMFLIIVKQSLINFI